MHTKLKTAVLTSLISAGTLFAAPAFAGWTVNGAAPGTVNISGGTTAVLAGIPTPCTANFTMSVDGSGNGTVTGVTFSGGGACGSISKIGTWNISAASPISGSTSVNLTISNIGIQFTVTGTTFQCTGGSTSSATLTNAHPNDGVNNNTLTFAATFTSGPCTGVKSNPSLTSNKRIGG